MSNTVIGALVATQTRGGPSPGPSVCRHSIGDASGRSIAFLSLVAASLCIGCANPGPPKPPSLHLPALVADLTAERTGNRVLLRWTTPSRTTDDLLIKGTMTAQICREAGPRTGTPTSRAAACAPVLRLAVAPGPSEVEDTLPASLCSDPVVLLTYRIQILNSTGRSAGGSTAAFTAAGTAPPPIDSLNGTPSERGVVLEWAAPTKGLTDPTTALVDLSRSDLSVETVAPKPGRPARPRPGGHTKSATQGNSAPQPGGPIHLRSQEPPSGTVDTSAKFGETYTYTASRLRRVVIGARTLEVRSGPSPPVTITLRDTFPPLAPGGLATVPGRGNGPSSSAATYIDLSWEPNAEPDLAGYLVYRQLASPNGDPQGPPARLTPTPIVAPVYRDVAVSPGQRYIYWVTAVDASGNESAPSAKAQEVVTPE